MAKKTALVFGISGQDGSLLAKLLLHKGYLVFGTARDCDLANFARLKRLSIFDQVVLRSTSLTDFRSVAQVISEVRPDEIYNLAGQSSVGLSFDQPVETIDSFVNGTINILEAVRLLGVQSRFYNASSSECFGDTGDQRADEETPFRPCSPYGVGKAAAHWLVSNYRDAYGVFACSGILFNHESPLRPARFVTQKIVQGAVDIAEGKTRTLELGNLGIKRDWGWAPEYVDAMWRMLHLEVPTDLVIATGHSHSLQEFVECAFGEVGLNWREHISTQSRLYRPLEIQSNGASPQKAFSILGWAASTDFPTIVKRMIAAEIDQRRQSQTTSDVLADI